MLFKENKIVAQEHCPEYSGSCFAWRSSPKNGISSTKLASSFIGRLRLGGVPDN